MARIVSLASANASTIVPVIYGGPLYPARDEDGEYVTFNWFVGVEIDGVCYEHPHSFRNNDKYGAEQFVEKISARGLVDLDLWNELPPAPTSEELAHDAWMEELEDRRHYGAAAYV